MADVLMPALGADMTHGKVLEWLVEPGQPVRHGDLIAVVDTDKAEIEIESFHDGVMGEPIVPLGERVAVGTPIGAIVTEGEPAGAAPEAAAAPPESAPEAAEPVQPAPAVAAPVPAHNGRLRVTPLARRVAARLGVDLQSVHGTGPGGAIVRDDVERAGAPPAAAATTPKRATAAERTAAMRSAIAALMARSKREIPHYYLQSTIDVSRAQARLDEINAQRPPNRRLLPAAYLLHAVALATARNPALNGYWIDGEAHPAEQVNLGVAVSLRGGGVVAPAILEADRLDLDGTMAALRDLVARARSGRLRRAEMTEGTITVTQLGDRGADLVHGVIFAPQLALVGFGRIRTRPWAENDMIAARPTVVATLAADHRASDGHAGSLLLDAIDDILRRPEEW
ncbi:MAG: dihydrolipoamide acetyltransferase family protein [Solirubrobacteraceae bacterium]